MNTKIDVAAYPMRDLCEMGSPSVAQRQPVCLVLVPGGAQELLTHPVTACFGKSNRDTNPNPKTVPLRELFDDFSRPDTRRGKLSSAEYHALRDDIPEEKRRKGEEKNGRYFCIAQFRGPNTREQKDVVSVSGFALDFDTGKTTEQIIREKLAGITYVAYTSYSHRPGKERWRVFIPYREPVGIEHHQAVHEHFQALFDNDLDPRCGVAAQVWYTPACPRDAEGEFRCFHQVGTLFDPLTVARPRAASKPEQPPSPSPSASPSASAEHVAATLKRLASALEHLDHDDREIWVKVGLAIKHDLGDAGRQAWLDWSAKSPAKFSHDDAVDEWESFKRREPGEEDVVTLGTVFHLAKQAGWHDRVGPPHIAEMNEEFFVAPIGAQMAIFRKRADPNFGYPMLIPMKPEAFRLLLGNRFHLVQTANGDVKQVSLAKVWLEHPARREYDGVVLAPNEDVPGYYNRWRGFAVQPAKGEWRRMRWHILFVICGGSLRLYRYVLGWLAYCVQHPDRPVEVALVLRGGRGAGKGMFARTVGSLFGLHFRHVTHAKHVSGQFNAHLADCILLFADEAFWAGDKQGESTLKAYITEPTIMLERKGFDAEQVPNRLKIIMASNNDWVVPAGLDERRFCVLAVSDVRQQDATYFGELQKEIDGVGREAMLYDLLHRDLRRFDIRKVPNTDALKEQKLLSLSPIERWWLDMLEAGEWVALPGQNGVATLTFPWTQVPRFVVHNIYVQSLQKTGVARRSTETELGAALRKLLPPGWPKDSKAFPLYTTGGVPSRVNHYLFPPLDQCRAHFEKIAGMPGRDWS